MVKGIGMSTLTSFGRSLEGGGSYQLNINPLPTLHIPNPFTNLKPEINKFYNL
jgi:hypothetical protein